METSICNSTESLVFQTKQPGSQNQPAKPIETVSSGKLDDASLMHLLAKNQAEALRDLYDRYGSLVYRIALNTIGDQAAAEEIVQDVFTRAWKKANTYDARIARVSTWLISITRNRAIDQLRKDKLRPEKTSVNWSEVSRNQRPTSPGPEVETELSWRQKMVREALETLPPEQREALALAYFKGYSQSRIAKELGVPLGTVKTRIRLAMQKLRLVLSQTVMEDT